RGRRRQPGHARPDDGRGPDGRGTCAGRRAPLRAGLGRPGGGDPVSDKHDPSLSAGSDAGEEQANIAAPPAEVGAPEGASAEGPTPEGPTHREGDRPSVLHQILSGSALMSVLAVVLALLIGGLLIAFADQDTREASGYFFSRPSDTL